MKTISSFALLNGVALLCTTSLLFQVGNAKAQEPDFRGAAIQNIRVTRSGPGAEQGSATYTYTIRQNFSTSDETFLKGPSPAGTVNTASISREQGFDLKSVPYQLTTYSGKVEISEEKLDCSQPQDICRGCVALYQYWQTRTDDIENDDPENRAGFIYSQFSVLRGSGANVAAPSYAGPIFMRTQKGKDFSLNLRPYISYPGAITCSLAQATYRNGLIENPKADTGPLSISEDCNLKWNIADSTEVQVGNQFNFQLLISAVNEVNNTSCVPKTIVDLQLEVTCPDSLLSTGDPSCFLCSEVDITEPRDAIAAEISREVKVHRRFRRKMLQRVEREENQDIISRSKVRKIRVKMRKVILELKKLLTAHQDLLALNQMQTQCAAASQEFCSASSNLRSLEPLMTLISGKSIIEEQAYKSYRAVKKLATGKNGRSQAEKAREKMQLFMEKLEALTNQIPKSNDSCGTINS
ncbi:MAG: hypothetical protein KDD60_05535 [Bdellovibrionales bacterium]|nr:hypothetical protein [Bdellovibrionales bacterium]